jgi:murein DD-endopeptidase MepM/ murein hydrolase activator NlpD
MGKKKNRDRRSTPGIWLICGVIAALALALFGLMGSAAAAGSASPASSSLTAYNDLVFSEPFGSLVPHLQFRPRITKDKAGKLIEDTSYGIRNPDMGGGTCFGVNWSRIYHAGEDLYAGQAGSSQSTQNAEVRAVADGFVKFAPTSFNFPGFVVVIEHTLRSGEKIYSLYAHLKGPLNVKAGQKVSRGQVIGRVMYLPYSGNYPRYHTSVDDSHLHFELRQFYSGANIYPYPYGYCNKASNVPGVGYTYPSGPDKFPSASQHYLNPPTFIAAHQHHFYMPLISNVH